MVTLDIPPPPYTIHHIPCTIHKYCKSPHHHISRDGKLLMNPPWKVGLQIRWALFFSFSTPNICIQETYQHSMDHGSALKKHLFYVEIAYFYPWSLPRGMLVFMWTFFTQRLNHGSSDALFIFLLLLHTSNIYLNDQAY